MRSAIIVLILLSLALSQAFAQAEGSETLTLEKALGIALDNNKDIKIAIDEYNKSKGGLREAHAAFNPSVSLDTTYMRMGPESSFDFQGEKVQITQAEKATTEGKASMPVDISGSLRHARSIARLSKDVAFLSVQATVGSVIFDVKSAYYNYLRALGSFEAAQSAVKSAEATLKDTRLTYEAGKVAKFDVMRAEVQVVNLQQNVILAENGLELARSALNNVLGIDINDTARVESVEVDVSDSINTDIGERTAQAYEKRPEVKQAEAGVDIGEKSVDLQETGNLPSLGLSFTYTWDYTPGGLAAQKESWVMASFLSIPIWDGGVTQAKVDQAKAELGKSENTLDKTRLAIALDVKNSILDYEAAKKRVETTKDNLALAEEALRLANVRYKAKRSPLLEVTDAESALTDARVNHVNAKYDYMTAVAALERATFTQPEIEQIVFSDF